MDEFGSLSHRKAPAVQPPSAAHLISMVLARRLSRPAFMRPLINTKPAAAPRKISASR
jgi:hypothetical protein